MDYDKYYIERDGQYSIHFANKEGYSEDEIREIFIKYGNVLSVKIPGDIRGFCFIKYKTLSDVKSCLNGLQNNKSIRILKQKSKMNTETKDESGKNTQKKNSQNNRIFNRENRNTHLRSRTPDKYSNNFDDDQKSDQKSRRSMQDYQSEFTDKKAFNKDSWSDTSSVHSTINLAQDKQEINMPNAMEPTSSQLLKLQRMRGVQANTFSPSRNEESGQKHKEEVDESEIPALVCRENLESSNDSTSSDLTKISKTVLASEVVVANIHSNFGIHYILHLFESHNPISVTLMSTVHGTSIRYCHVYFKRQEDAVMVEKKFDKYLLMGKNLIVVRPKTLIPDSTETF